MAMKTAFAEIVDGRLILPAEALAVLPGNTRLFVIADSEKGTVSIYARDPMNRGAQELLDALSELNDGLTLDEYTEPVSDNELRRRKQGGGERKE